jgi:hypothetical protein
MTYRTYRPTIVQKRRFKADLQAFKDTTKDFEKSANKDLKAFEDLREELLAVGIDLESFKTNANASKLLSQQWQDMKSSTPPADVERQKAKLPLDQLNPALYTNVVTITTELINAIAKFARLFDVEGGYTIEMDN